MRWMVLVPLLVAACASHEPPAIRDCRARANDDPAVRRLLADSAGSPIFAKDHRAALHDARRSAMLACLRKRGVAAPGGVEAPKARQGLFGGLF